MRDDATGDPPGIDRPADDAAPAEALGVEAPDAGAPTLPPEPAEDDDGGIVHFLKELPVLIAIAFGLALLIKTFLAQAFFIPSESMVPTLQIDDRVLVNKLVYRFRDPRRGEIVVFVAEKPEPKPFLSRVRSFLTEGLGVVRPEEKDFIKRVIGLPGETIEIDRRGRVTITPADGDAPFVLDEPYLDAERDLTAFGPFTVPADSYFVMGDNRAHSSDSRKQLGPVQRSDIIGKAFMRIWPPSRAGFFRTPHYDDAPGEPDVETEEARAPPPWRAGDGLAIGWPAWSLMGVSSSNSAMRGSGSWPAWTRRDVARSPVRSSRAR